MGALRNGCIEILLFWAAAGYALYSYFHGRFEPPGDIWGAAVGGFLLASSWGSLRGVLSALRRARLLRRSKFGLAPTDGKLFAAAGKIHPTGEGLKTPFQKLSCVVYSYEVYVGDSSSSSSTDDSQISRGKTMSMGGFAMCPCAVRTKSGDVRILGFPFPTAYPEQLFMAAEMLEQINAHVAATKFEETKSVEVVSIFAEMKRLMTEDKGAHRYDWKTPKLTSMLEDSDAKVMEQFIPSNDDICVIGTYSQSKGGLLNDYSSGGLEILRGSVDEGIRALIKRAIWALVLAILFGAAGSYGALTILKTREAKDTRILGRHQEQFVAALRANDPAAVEAELSRGVSPNEEANFVEEELAQIKSKEMLDVLLRHNYDLKKPRKSGYNALLYAALRKNIPLVRLLLDAGADPNFVQQEWKINATERAFDGGDEELFQLLISHGGTGLYVTEVNGTPIAPDGPEMQVVRQLFKVYKEENLPALRAMTDNWPQDYFESFERGLYRGSRVCEPEPQFDHGFVNAEGASVTVICEHESYREAWVITLIRSGAEWKVRREALVQ